MLETLDRHDGDHVVASEGRLVDLDGEHTMITVGLSTFTPWDTPREASEEEIARAIDEAAAAVPDVGRCVFNLHCPPKDTPIDTCLKLEVRPGELPRPIREAGRFVTTGGGSRAVKEAIERYQPLVGLHGHIHESGGRFRIGRTQTFNPGSEQHVQGTLNGWTVARRGRQADGLTSTRPDRPRSVSRDPRAGKRSRSRSSVSGTRAPNLPVTERWWRCAGQIGQTTP